MNHSDVARKLSVPKREVLIEHLDGGEWIEALVVVRNSARNKTIHVLMDDGLIRYAGYGRSGQKTTRITDDGRMVLALVLASYAESLIRAGCGVHAEGDGPISNAARRVITRIAPMAKAGAEI